MNGRSGFSLLEMVVVLGVIALILGASITFFGPVRDTAAETATEGKISEVTAKLETYRLNAGHYPSQEQGLGALVARPEASPRPRKWKRMFLQLPVDSWGREFGYFNPGRVVEGTPEVVSAGVDGAFDTEDDLSSQDL